MSQKTALITGIWGQDGRLLAGHLLGLGYRVIGVSRPGRAQFVDAALPAVHCDFTDITDPVAVRALIETWRPDEIYHLAAFHHSSQENSIGAALSSRGAMLATNFLSTKNLAFAMMETRTPAHLVFASSSQMFTAEKAIHEITEDTLRKPSTFYGHTKSWGMDLLAFLRAEHGIRASTAILFNHESPLRGEQFVSRKITRAAAAAKMGSTAKLVLQNIGARVDWSSARDVICALHLLSSDSEGQDCVVASGELHSVGDFVETAFSCLGLDWRSYVEFQDNHEIPALVGKAEKIREALGWAPACSFENMIKEMVNQDMQMPSRKHD